MNTKKIVNIIIFLLLITIVFFIFRKSTINNFNEFNVTDTELKDKIDSRFKNKVKKTRNTYTYDNLINCIDDCKLHSFFDTNYLKNNDIKKKINTFCKNVCNSQGVCKDIDKSRNKKLQLGADCKWLSLKEYRGPSKILKTDVNIEYICNVKKISKYSNVSTCLDYINIRWKTPYSFNFIKRFVLKLVKKELGKNPQEAMYFVDTNDLDKNHYILNNNKNTFFFLEKNIIYELYILSVDSENKKSPLSDKILILDEDSNCKNEACEQVNEDFEKKRIIDFKQDKINSFLEKIVK